MKRPKIEDTKIKSPSMSVSGRSVNVYEYSKMQDNYIDYLESKLKNNKDLVNEWSNKQIEYQQFANSSVEHHVQIRFNAKAQATRDCWKELKRAIEDN